MMTSVYYRIMVEPKEKSKSKSEPNESLNNMTAPILVS